MFPGRLDETQQAALRALAPLGGALTGGGALAGIWLGHRVTKDLDLFWHGRELLGSLVDDCAAALRSAGLQARIEERHPSFARLLVQGPGGSTVVDLVAERVPVVVEPVVVDAGGTPVLVDAPHEILVNKLCTLLSRSEPRDLFDVRALLAVGGDLDRAVTDGTRKEAGMSGPTLAWILGTLRISAAGPILGLDPAEVAALGAFRDELADRLVRLATP